MCRQFPLQLIFPSLWPKSSFRCASQWTQNGCSEDTEPHGQKHQLRDVSLDRAKLHPPSDDLGSMAFTDFYLV